MIKDASNAIYLAEAPTVGQPQSWRDTTNWGYSGIMVLLWCYDVYGGKHYLQMSNLMGQSLWVTF